MVHVPLQKRERKKNVRILLCPTRFPAQSVKNSSTSRDGNRNGRYLVRLFEDSRLLDGLLWSEGVDKTEGPC